jgi:hypothetical protein
VASPVRAFWNAPQLWAAFCRLVILDPPSYPDRPDVIAIRQELGL